MTDREADALYTHDLRGRERAASRYTAFPNGRRAPVAWRAEWDGVLDGRDPTSGGPWPDELVARCRERVWPQHAFGTANAGVLVLWNRPRTGLSVHTKKTPHWPDPRTPVLGGIPHAQVAGWWPLRVPDNKGWGPSWENVRHYLSQGLEPFGLKRPLSTVMWLLSTRRSDEPASRTMRPTCAHCSPVSPWSGSSQPCVRFS